MILGLPKDVGAALWMIQNNRKWINKIATETWFISSTTTKTTGTNIDMNTKTPPWFRLIFVGFPFEAFVCHSFYIACVCMSYMRMPLDMAKFGPGLNKFICHHFPKLKWDRTKMKQTANNAGNRMGVNWIQKKLMEMKMEIEGKQKRDILRSLHVTKVNDIYIAALYPTAFKPFDSESL